MTIRLTEMVYYPVKSCRGMALEQGTVGLRGFLDDRDYMLVDQQGIFLSQREFPRLALVQVEIRGDSLRLNAPGQPEFELMRTHDGPLREVVVWHDNCLAIDTGDAAAEWFGAYLGFPCRLVRQNPQEARQVAKRYAITEADQTSFSDGFPFLLVNQASLDALNARLDFPVPVDRFRPNLVISGAEAFEEDTWETIKIGRLTFSVVKPCARCKIVTVDQESGTTGKEPLRTLSLFRKVGDKVMFGQNLIHSGTGKLFTGDPVQVLKRKPAEQAAAQAVQ